MCVCVYVCMSLCVGAHISMYTYLYRLIHFASAVNCSYTFAFLGKVKEYIFPLIMYGPTF